jgi:hypothetical protein
VAERFTAALGPARRFRTMPIPLLSRFSPALLDLAPSPALLRGATPENDLDLGFLSDFDNGFRDDSPSETGQPPIPALSYADAGLRETGGKFDVPDLVGSLGERIRAGLDSLNWTEFAGTRVASGP